MAQIKRKKVSNKAVKGQKKENTLLKSKKFWIILSSSILGAAIIGVSIWLIVYFTTQNNTKDNPDFFGKSTEYVDVYKDKTDNKAITFNKISYDGLLMHSESTDDAKVYDEYIFVFAANLSTFYVDDTVNTGKDSDDAGYINKDVINEYKALYKQLAYLQYQIDLYNASKEIDANVVLYIIDTANTDNTGILTDTKFGGSDSNSSAVTFFLYSYNELIKFADTDEQKKLTGSTVSEVTNTCVNWSVNLMKENFQIEDNKQ